MSIVKPGRNEQSAVLLIYSLILQRNKKTMTIKGIGAGLGRTGTASLKVALEQYSFCLCYHMGEVLLHVEQRVPLWIEAAKGNPDWDTIFEGYQSATDYPSCSFWREQMEYFPEAKAILSTRSPESWFESVNSTIMSSSVNDWLRSIPVIKLTRWIE